MTFTKKGHRVVILLCSQLNTRGHFISHSGHNKMTGKSYHYDRGLQFFTPGALNSVTPGLKSYFCQYSNKSVPFSKQGQIRQRLERAGPSSSYV